MNCFRNKLVSYIDTEVGKPSPTYWPTSNLLTSPLRQPTPTIIILPAHIIRYRSLFDYLPSLALSRAKGDTYGGQ